MSAKISSERLDEFKLQNQDTFNHVMDILDDKSWSKSKTEDDVDFYTRTEKSSSFSQVKAITTFKAPFDKVIEKLDVIEQIKPGEAKSGLTERYTIYGPDDDNNWVVYISQKIPAPMVAPRDYLFFRHKYQVDENTVAYIHTSIVDDKLKPQVKGTVRANMIFQAFIAQKNKNTVTLSLLAHMDPCGSMPSFAFNMAVTKQGYAVRGIRNSILSELKEK